MNAKASAVERSIREKLEQLLSSGAPGEQLVREMLAICGTNPNAPFEALALIDQNHRLGRISSETYKALKWQAERLALGRPKEAPAARGGPMADPAQSGARLGPGVNTPAAASPASARPATRPLSVEDLRPGKVLADRYEIETRIYYGGGVAAFRARDRLRSELPAAEQRVVVRCPMPAADAHREFARAQTLAHANILRVLEFGRDHDLPFYTVEWRPGRTLREILGTRAAGPLPTAQALAIVREIGAAIIHAHGHNSVHGTLTPENIWVGDDGAVLVLNFGSLQAEALLPEERDDLNALAVLAYELLAGAHPFGGQTAIEAQRTVQHVKRPAGLSAAQWRALQQGLSYNEKHRAVLVKAWLPRLLGKRAAETLPPLEVLLTLPPGGQQPRRLGQLALAAAVLALGVGLAFFGPELRRLLSGDSAAPAVAPPPLAGSPGAAGERVAAGDPTAPVARIPAAEEAMAPRNVLRAALPPDSRPAPPLASAPPLAAPAATAGPGNAAAPAALPPAAPAPTVVGSPLSPPAPVAATVDESELPVEQRPGRLSFLADRVVVPQGTNAVRVRVSRSNGIAGDVSFEWWTENGTAKDGEDFVSLGHQTMTIKAGEEAATLLVPLIAATPVSSSLGGDASALFKPAVSAARRNGSVEFFVQIANPSGGASLGRNSRVTITLE